MATTNGTIKRITDKGFGFIAASDGTEYFFHQSACVGTRFDELREGQRVTFTPGRCLPHLSFGGTASADGGHGNGGRGSWAKNV